MINKQSFVKYILVEGTYIRNRNILYIHQGIHPGIRDNNESKSINHYF